MDFIIGALSFFIFTSLYFQVFLLITYLENKNSFFRKQCQNKKPASGFLPSVTIIVPCWNEEKTVTKTLRSLSALNYPKEKLFIFVVDDGSIDGTKNAVKPFVENGLVKYFYKENGGKHTALNLGINNAKTDLVGCLDADSFVSENALLAAVKELENPEIMTVTPAIKVHDPKTVIQRIQETEYTIGIIFRKLLASINAQYVAPGPFSIYRRSVFNIVGKFKHAHNTEDMEMAMRMQGFRLKLGNAFNAEVYTNTPATLRKLIRQRLRWTYGFIKNAIDYKFLLFKKGYGNIGFFSLPAALISIAAALYFAFYFARGVVLFVYEKITYLSTVGLNHALKFKFSWFFINTEVITLLIYLSAAVFLILLTISIYHVRGRIFFKKSDVYFVLLYGLIAPLWMIRAVAQLILRQPSKWR